jgi:hypothetical protein
MVDNIGPFLGEWNVGMTGTTGYLKQGYKICIGTGKFGDSLPFLTEAYKTCVGFAIFNEQGEKVAATGDSPDNPMLLLFAHGTLRNASYYDGLPVRFYISMAEAEMPTVGTVYPAIYGTTTSGDPDQVGVWGADGNPPPHPKPKE